MIENIYLTWTEEQVRILNKFQSSGVFHSFTCPNDGNDLLEEDLIDNYISWLKFK
jgi:hypothetical protein